MVVMTELATLEERIADFTPYLAMVSEDLKESGYEATAGDYDEAIDLINDLIIKIAVRNKRHSFFQS